MSNKKEVKIPEMFKRGVKRAAESEKKEDEITTITLDSSIEIEEKFPKMKIKSSEVEVHEQPPPKKALMDPIDIPEGEEPTEYVKEMMEKVNSIVESGRHLLHDQFLLSAACLQKKGGHEIEVELFRIMAFYSAYSHKAMGLDRKDGGMMDELFGIEENEDYDEKVFEEYKKEVDRQMENNEEPDGYKCLLLAQKCHGKDELIERLCVFSGISIMMGVLAFKGEFGKPENEEKMEEDGKENEHP